jgi:hypothetical protein
MEFQNPDYLGFHPIYVRLQIAIKQRIGYRIKKCRNFLMISRNILLRLYPIIGLGTRKRGVGYLMQV